MLQQTRVDQVVPFYKKFTRQFPTATRLASASTGEVLKAWYGLGYNRRAVNLQKTATAIMGKPLPTSARALEELPGLGRYSANAIATFAWNAPEPLLETNTVRVLHRVFVGPELPKTRRTRAQLYALAESVLDRRNPRRWNEALFDLGATVCGKRRPRCAVCPLQSHCRATPRILALAALPRQAKSEPQFRGEPRRLWRGRALRVLHNGPRTATDVTRELNVPDGSVGYVRVLLQTLVSEGLLRSSHDRFALPGPGVR
jgi:A/G-specific adenine glycosylase